jgi:hypothetical protein
MVLLHAGAGSDIVDHELEREIDRSDQDCREFL